MCKPHVILLIYISIIPDSQSRLDYIIIMKSLKKQRILVHDETNFLKILFKKNNKLEIVENTTIPIYMTYTYICTYILLYNTYFNWRIILYYI